MATIRVGKIEISLEKARKCGEKFKDFRVIWKGLCMYGADKNDNDKNNEYRACLLRKG